jgi:hypothetical protein
MVFRDGVEIVIVPHDADEITRRVACFYDRPWEIYALAACGQARFREVFAIKNQMRRCFKIMENLLNG